MQFVRSLKIALLATVVTVNTSGSFAVDGAATTDLNIRTGPGVEYAVLATLRRGEIVEVTECQTNGWCMIYHDGPDGWVSGSYLTQVNARPAPPPPQQHTPAPSPSGHLGNDDASAALAFAAILGLGAVIVGSAIANSNNSAPPVVADTCKQGFVWREANGSDHVCVTPQRRAKAAKENQTANWRVNPNGPYGPNSCKQGFVWREVNVDDKVCVTPMRRAQVKQENLDGPANRA